MKLFGQGERVTDGERIGTVVIPYDGYGSKHDYTGAVIWDGENAISYAQAMTLLSYPCCTLTEWRRIVTLAKADGIDV